jgi:hypothetical protein
MGLFDITGAGRLLGDVGGSIFGKPSQTNPSQIAGIQSPFLQDLYRQAQQYVQGPTTSPLEQQGQQAAVDYAGQLNPQLQAAQGAQQFLTSPNILSPESNPYLAQTAKAATSPIMQALMEQILPNIRSGAVGAGGYGGSRQGIAEGIAGRGALQQIGDTTANIYSQAYGQGLNAMQGGLQAAPQTAALGLLPSQIMQQVGQEQRLAPFQQLQNYQGLLGAPVVLGGGGTGGTRGLADMVNLNIGA